MTVHQFAVHDRVRLAAGTVLIGGSKGTYEITRQLPISGGKNSYRIKSPDERFERFVTEDQLLAEKGSAMNDLWKIHG